MPAIRDGLHERFGARSPRLDNADRIISEGAAWIAHDDLRLALAKPIELLQSDDTYAPVVPLPFLLPLENQSIPAASAVYRCVDPRSGRASFTFARPRGPRARDTLSERQVHATYQLDIDETAPPLMERLELNVTIDHDYVAHVDLYSTMRRQRLKAEIFDLEFTVAFPFGTNPETGTSQTDREDDSTPAASGSANSTAQGGRVRLRSNISAAESWQNVPGDLVIQYQPSWFDERTRAYSNWQKEEWTYYKDCPYCHRRRYQYWTEGCNAAQCLWRLAYPVKNGVSFSQEQPIKVMAPEPGLVDLPTVESFIIDPSASPSPVNDQPLAPTTPEYAGNNSEEAGDELQADGDVAAPVPHTPTVTVPSPKCPKQEDNQPDQQEEEQKKQRSPRQFRVTPRLPPLPRSPAGTAQPEEVSESRENDRVFPLDVRLTYEKAGFCRISLLPRRAADFPATLEVATGDALSTFVVLQDEWYQDVIPEHLGTLLQKGIEWDAQLPNGRHVRWSLGGRPIYVLGHHDKLSGFVATQRLTIGEEHVVLCLDERLQEVKEAIDLTGSPPAIELNENNGLPHGWIGLRGVQPRKPVPSSPEGSILDLLRPLADVNISFEGGIRIDRQAWLHGYPPQIQLRGDTNSVNGLLIDGTPAVLTSNGFYEADGWDSPGEHSVWCPSASRSYIIRDMAEAWEPWNAYTWSLGTFAGTRGPIAASICGALVRPSVEKVLPVVRRLSRPLIASFWGLTRVRSKFVQYGVTSVRHAASGFPLSIPFGRCPLIPCTAAREPIGCC